VLDSVGCGELPDASVYGDEGSNTLGNVARETELRVPHLRALGLDRVMDLSAHPRVEPLAGPVLSASAKSPADRRSSPQPSIGWSDRPSAYGRMAEASAGKDSVTGHWEMMGIVLDRPFPTFPHGFPHETIQEFETRIGRPVLGNVVASGTEIITKLGAEHVRTGRPIVYTSADSVFQIAAHEDVIPVPELYRMCEIAFDLVGKGMGVGRVIARPFVGKEGAFARTANRHDYALNPTGDTLLDYLTREGIPVIAIGKVKDLFAGRGIARAFPTASDDEGITRVVDTMKSQGSGLIFANLVDFDTVYGHRNDVEGYARNLERFDERLPAVVDGLRTSDLLVITADHGNDPTTPSTDHSREYVPLLMTGSHVRRDVSLGTRATFADLGQTLADNFGVGPLAHGTSFLEDIVAQHS